MSTWKVKEKDEDKSQMWSARDLDVASKIKATKISPQAVLDSDIKNVFVQMTTTEARRLALHLLMVVDVCEQKDFDLLSLQIYLKKQETLGTYPIGITVNEKENQ